VLVTKLGRVCYDLVNVKTIVIIMQPVQLKTDRINAVLFDKDGTLVDYHASWAPINRASAVFAERRVGRGNAALPGRQLAGGWKRCGDIGGLGGRGQSVQCG
jgi:hypothetical protein